MANDIDDFLEDEKEQTFEGLSEIIELIKKHSIYNYEVLGNQLTFIAVGNTRFRVTYVKKGICPECGKETNFNRLSRVYFKFCSPKCSSQSLETKRKIKLTINKRDDEYGYHIRVANDEFLPLMDDFINSLADLKTIMNRWISIYKKSYTDPDEHQPDWD